MIIDNISLNTAIISHLDKFDKKQLISNTKSVNITMIGIDAYYITCHLKKAQVFILFLRDFQYQITKKAKAKINSKNIIPEEYYDFLIYFLRKT